MSAEPLAETAPVARLLAHATCRAGCEPYHGLVQHLRLLGVVAGPDRHAGFYQEALASVAGRGGRVLIAGAADYGMAAQVLDAFAAVDRVPRITVIDLCPTPLLLTTWYAAERGAHVTTALADAERYVPDEPVDAVVTDSLLTLLAPEGRQRALAAWSASLAPGGHLVTTLRIADGPRPSGRAATDAFVAWIVDEAARRGGLADLDAGLLEEAARRYADAPITLAPVRSRDEIVAAIESAGLRIERLDDLELPGNAPEDAAGPGVHRGEHYVRVVAVRP
jgi:hypothetical protein